MKAFLFVVLAFVGISFVAEGQIELLKDINQDNKRWSSSSAPMSSTTIGTTTYFWQLTKNSQYLYKTNGTTVEIVKPAQSVHNLKLFKNKLYFSGSRNSPWHATIWYVDPSSEEATEAVSFPYAEIDTMIVHNGELYVATSAPSPDLNVEFYDYAIWKTDGTQAGTTMIKHMGGVFQSFKNMTPVGDKVYFTLDGFIDQTQYGNEIWVSDGTEAGTYPIDYAAGPTGADYNNLRDGGDGLLYFTFSQDRALARTDGTLAGTVDVYFDAQQKPHEVTRANGKTYFATYSSLWTTDGTEVGTVKVKDMGNQSEGVRELISFRDSLFFIGPDDSGQTDLWKSDGTTSGTKRCNIGSHPYYGLTPFGEDSLYYFRRGINGDDLIKSNTKPYNQKVILSGTNNYQSFNGGHVYITDSRIYFNYGANNPILWTSEGTGSLATTHAIPNVNQGTGDSHIDYGGAVLNGKFIFDATDRDHGASLWITDGTTAGTQLLKDLLPGQATTPQNFFQHKDHVYFTAYTGTPYSIWKTDGTAEGTVRIKDLAVQKFFSIGDQLYFMGYVFGNTSTTVYKTDGTSEGTIAVSSELPGEFAEPPAGGMSIAIFNDVAYFSLYTFGKYQVWRTDGTNDGTFATSIPSDAAIQFVTAGSKLYFNIASGSGIKLQFIEFASLPKNVHEFPSNSRQFLQPVGNKVLISFESEIWSSDGTSAGTVLIGQGINQTDNLNIVPAIGSTLFLDYYQMSTKEGYELWKTDGTVDGTSLVKDIDPNYLNTLDYVGSNGSFPMNLTPYGDRIFFTTQWNDLWTSKGTAESTVKVATNDGIGITGMSVLGDRLIIMGSTDAAGSELFVFDINSIKQEQSITFTTPTLHVFGDADFTLTATATSGLPVTFSSSNSSVLKVTGNSVEIIGAGEADLIAHQQGNGDYLAATDVVVHVIVTKKDQLINFTEISTQVVGGPDITLVATSTTGDPVVFSSTSPTISITGNKAHIISAGTTTITASIQDDNNTTGASENLTFCINPLPPTLTFSSDKISSSADVNTWFKDDIEVPGETSKQLTVSETGKYKATTSADGCTSGFSTAIQVTFTGLEDDLQHAIVSPNPAKDFVYLKWTGNEEINIELINTVGQSMGQSLFKKISQDTYRADTKDISTGMYILRITSSQTTNLRLVINH